MTLVENREDIARSTLEMLCWYMLMTKGNICGLLVELRLFTKAVIEGFGLCLYNVVGKQFVDPYRPSTETLPSGIECVFI